MCGIIGILGKTDVQDRIVDGLSRLEYRGYDSAGVAIMSDAKASVSKAVGKLENLRTELARKPLVGRVGIGHTRWATHGAANTMNAHPHRAEHVTVVHNGIIENHAELKSELTAQGAVFASETDTEVIAQLMNVALRTASTLDEAFSNTLAKLVGSFAIAVIVDGYEDIMLVARNGSPLAIGYGDPDASGTSEMFVGSDALALAPFTENVSYLEDGDWAVITPARVIVRDQAGSEVVREIQHVPVENFSVDKGPYKHFMLKEIHEQPESLARCLRGLIDHNTGTLKPFLEDVDFTTADRIILVACGTAYYACATAKYWFEEFVGIPVEIDIASEFRYRKVPLTGKEIAIFVSQSGETADTLSALKNVKVRVQNVVAVVNVTTSSIAREADAILDIAAGPEIGVASTKAFTGQLLSLLGIALKAGYERGVVCEARLAGLVSDISSLPRLLTETLKLESQMQEIGASMAHVTDAYFLGRGILYPIALEGALKLKEISYIHAEGYAAGELKHGPIALIEHGVPVIVLSSNDELNEKTRSNAAEVVARGARLIEVGCRDADKDKLALPQAPDAVMPFLHAVAVQLISYFAALAKGTDVDQPKNLAKSVTVE
ncbi:glutamine--fructose-6-phosphate transaminase (isomerizing) [Planktomarina temperata]|nr:glutamine--fructose-6-phosphate transaminase (isomerizing) [Planktomarina temperata]